MELRRSRAVNSLTIGVYFRVLWLSPVLRDFLETHGQIPMLLRTPYGITATRSYWVRSDIVHAVSSGKSEAYVYSPAPELDLGEQISKWYGLRLVNVVERVRVTVEFCLEGELRVVLVPLAIKMTGSLSWKDLPSTTPEPLGLNSSSLGKVWRAQIKRLADAAPQQLFSIRRRVRNLLRRHPHGSSQVWKPRDVEDISRVLEVCGCSLRGRHGNSPVFTASKFRFARLPPYWCAVELRDRLRRFNARKYFSSPLPRALVLTIRDQPNFLSRNFDYFSVEAFSGVLG